MSRNHLRISSRVLLLAMLALGLVRPARAQNATINASPFKGINRLRPMGNIQGSSVITINLLLPIDAATIYFDVETTAGFTYSVSFFSLPEETSGMQSTPQGIWFCNKQPGGGGALQLANSTSSTQVITAGVADTYACPVPAHGKLQIVFTMAAGGASPGAFYVIVTGNGSIGYGRVAFLDPCQDPQVAKITVPINATATTILQAGVTGAKVYVCGFSFTIAGSATATANFSQGTGAACATGLTALTGNYLGGTVPVLAASGGGGYTVVNTTVSQNICIAPGGGTPSVQGYVSLTQL
jgi:hypothetical protein